MENNESKISKKDNDIKKYLFKYLLSNYKEKNIIIKSLYNFIYRLTNLKIIFNIDKSISNFTGSDSMFKIISTVIIIFILLISFSYFIMHNILNDNIGILTSFAFLILFIIAPLHILYKLGTSLFKIELGYKSLLFCNVIYLLGKTNNCKIPITKELINKMNHYYNNDSLSTFVDAIIKSNPYNKIGIGLLSMKYCESNGTIYNNLILPEAKNIALKINLKYDCFK